jgi:hypothetical protein
MLLEEIVLDLSVFKRALRGEDKIAFDSLMNKARSHASSFTVTPCLSRWMLRGFEILQVSFSEVNGVRLSMFLVLYVSLLYLLEGYKQTAVA